MLPTSFPEANTEMPFGEGSVPACVGFDKGVPFFITAWKPSKEDLDSLNNGGAVILRLSVFLAPHVLFTLDAEGNSNYVF